MKIRIAENDLEFLVKRMDNPTPQSVCTAVHLPTGLRAVYRSEEFLLYPELEKRARRTLAARMSRWLARGCRDE